MISVYSLRKAIIIALGLIIVLSLFLSSCQKEITSAGLVPAGNNSDLTTKIAFAASGYVTDETNIAVEGATVEFGNSSTTTDTYGYFEFSNVQVVKNAAVVTVIKPGYFKGIKTCIATENKTAFFRIKLLPKTNQGNFDAATGGTVTLSNGLSVSFPDAAVQLAAGGTYSGQVTVAAHWIDPTANDLVNTMPGDLRGLDSAGFLKLLTSYGMAAVELTGSTGELLQVADGKKATLSCPIPASIAGSAPASIPMWSFNESNGLWKQEGHAVRSGNKYVGDVSHFSFWNYDTPNNFIQMRCTVKDTDGRPIPGAYVKVSVVSDPQTAAWGITDSAGFVGGAVPENAQLLLEVLGSFTCGNALYSQNFTTTVQNIDLGDIELPAALTSTINGNIINCFAAPVNIGYIMISTENYSFRRPLSSTGEFNITIPFCGSSHTIVLVAEDLEGLQTGTPVSHTITPGLYNAGTISVCGTPIQEYVYFDADGMNFTYLPPADTIDQTTGHISLSNICNIYASDRVGTDNNVSFSFTQNNIGPGSSQQLVAFYSMVVPFSDSMAVTGTSGVNITEYGNIGGYIAGNFNSTSTLGPPPGTTYTMTCRFRVKRKE